MPMFAALFLFAAPLRFEAPISERFVIAANGGAETFKTFLDENFATDDKAFLGRLEDFRKQAAPLTYIRKGFTSPSMEKALIKGKHGELTMTLVLNGGTPPKILGLMLGGPGEVDKPPAKQYTDWKSLQSLVDEIRTDNKVPAMGVGVIENGKLEVVVSGEREIGKGVPVKPDEIWNMGSIGKSFTSTLIGRLVEEGKLKWSSTLGELLPQLKMKDAYKSVKLSDVLRHRGGIPQDQNFTLVRVLEIVKGATDPVKVRTNYALDVLNRDPISKPGTEFAYSNAGYTLAGVIAETLTGKPYEQLLKEYVFEPLKLSTAKVGADELTKERPFGHMDMEGTVKRYDMGGILAVMIAPAGTVSCSLADLANYAQEHLKGLKGESKFLSKATFAELHRGEDEGGGQGGYACGWSIGPLPGTSVRHGHNGSNGTFMAEMAIFPDKDVVVVSVINRGAEEDVTPPLQAVIAAGRRFAPRKA